MYINKLSYIGIYLWKSDFGLTGFYLFFLRVTIKGKARVFLTMFKVVFGTSSTPYRD